MTIYGIKTCSTVNKAKKFLKDKGYEFDFVDLKTTKPSAKDIQSWVDKVGIDVLFNSRSTTYRELKLKELNLDDAGKFEWLCKEPILLKRPLVTFEDKVVVGFKEDNYKEIF
ncbi:MAG: Spx/MgsR family RNA polymerase-binding regulatory protein [Sulfurovum sp.]|jgi:Spx/MgsR family transcriptional regulator